MATVFYVTHPQVRIDPSIPVGAWGLSETGRMRAEAAATTGWTGNAGRILSSAETKAVETAQILARPLWLPVQVRQDLHENDRTSTGFLPPEEFERVADAFFAQPNDSVRGWERAIDAQARIVRAFDEELARDSGDRDVIIAGHGAVGTLLMTHLLGQAISRALDQPTGGGNVFAFDRDSRRVLHRWKPLEEMAR
ncbi:MAG: phosphoglycerate mutase family protein [Ancalomicrobiaceae bacterium]|nr:phosphoglycerate mutase family protein [Ancalomicrobiaceae bacterium]